VAAGVADALAAEALEWLQQAFYLVGRDHRPGVADRYCRMALPTRLAIRLSARAGSPVAGAAVRAAPMRMSRCSASWFWRRMAFPGDVGEIEGLPAFYPALTAGQG